MAFGVRTGAAAAAPWAVEFAEDAAPNGFPEIDCVRSNLSPAVARAAEQRAARLGVGADRVLIAAGRIDEDDYLRSLAASLGVAFEPLDGTPRSTCPVSDDRLIKAAAVGLLPLTVNNEPCVVVAPRGVAARQLIAMIEGNPALVRRFRFTSAERLTRFMLRSAGNALTARACDELRQTWPMLSAGPPRWRANLARVAVIAAVTVAVVAIAPAIALFAFELMLAAMFLAWLALRLTGVFVSGHVSAETLDVADDALPVYSIVAALYREAASVDGLLRAIERLDYPAEKLDVIIAVEADDHETRAAIAARTNRVPITVIPVAAGGPRTKPKALNFALPFARGTFTVIYDAEDRPQQGQLRRVLQAFRAGGDKLACVQARLCIDNTAGLMRRGLSANAWILVLTPLHWLLLSLAAWRALHQLVVAPYAWEKTEHGLAKSSRLAANLTRSLLELERYFRRHKESGELPALTDAARNTSATRRPRPRAAA